MTSQSEDGNEGDIELLVVNSDGLTLKHGLRLPDLLTDDAVFVSGVAFDAAYYHLSESEISFGLRIERRESSCPNPFGETVLCLFVIDNNELKPVLDNIVVAGHQGEWDTSCAIPDDRTHTRHGAPSTKPPFRYPRLGEENEGYQHVGPGRRVCGR